MSDIAEGGARAEAGPPPPRAERLAAGALGLLVALLPLAAVFALPSRLGLFVFDEQIAAVILGVGLAVVFLRTRADGSAGGAATAADRLLAAASLGFGIALAARFPQLSEGAFFRPVEAAVFGAAALALVVEGMRRVVGWTLIVVFAVLAAYALAGHLLPAAIAARRMDVVQFLGFVGSDSTALLGRTLQIACFVIIPFVMFGRILVAVGAAEVFEAIGARLAGRGPGGAGRVAIVSSMLFGTVSGSAVANVMANGVVTIGMMRRNGYTKDQAAATEAVSSTGGQMMPPVMGAAAFIMAEYLRVPYATVMLAAIIPAFLFYAATWIQLEFVARKLGLPAFAEVMGRPLSSYRVEAFLLTVAFVVLLGGIFRYNLPAELAAVYAAALLCVLGLALLRRRGFTGARLVRQVAETGLGAAEVLLVCALAGVIIGILTTTGLGFTLSLLLLEIGRASLFLLLVVTGLVSIILGMGMPTTAVYLLLATLAAPTLVQLGIQPIAAHMFVFYFGMLSMITPPVALAAFAAASIAGASPMRVGLTSVRLGWIAFLVPFLFVYQPGLLMQTGWLETAAVTVACMVAIPLVAAGLVGHAFGPLSPAQRLAALALGAFAIFPADHLPGGVWTEASSVLLGAAAIAWAWRRGGGPAPAAARTAHGGS
jgi:TRAP transporter 4TM/12TM fusion protein